MLGNFTYCNPTRLYFGEDSLSNLSTELKKYGQNVVLIYGGGSIKKMEFTMKLWLSSKKRKRMSRRLQA